MGDSKLAVFFDPGFEGLFGASKKGNESGFKYRALPKMVPGFLVFIAQEAVPISVIKIRTPSSLQFVQKGQFV